MEPHCPNNTEFESALYAYEATIRLAKLTDRAQTASGAMEGEPDGALDGAYQRIYDATVSRSDETLARVILAPAPDLGKILIKLKLLMDEHFPLQRGEGVYDRNADYPFSPHAALARITADLEALCQA